MNRPSGQSYAKKGVELEHDGVYNHLPTVNEIHPSVENGSATSNTRKPPNDTVNTGEGTIEFQSALPYEFIGEAIE